MIPRIFLALALAAILGLTVESVRADSHTYVIAEWEWRDNAWFAPECLTPVVDLRTIPEMSNKGFNAGEGLFLVNEGCRWTGETFDSTAAMDLAWDRLMGGSDPKGINGPKPLMPNSNGRISLTVADRSRSEDFNPEIHVNQIRVYQDDYERIKREHGNSGLHLRVADYWRDQLGVDPRNNQQKRDGFLPHETILIESFNQANTSVLGPLQTWLEITDGGGIADWDIVSKDARYGATQPQNRTAYVNSPLSTDNQIISVNYRGSGGFTSVNSEGVGPAARVLNSGIGTLSEAYIMSAIDSSIDDAYRIDKVVGGVYTRNVDSVNITPLIGDLMRLEINGSTIQGRVNNTVELDVVDTSITGNPLVGIWGNGLSSGDFGELRNFEARDIEPSGGQDVTEIDFTTFVYIAGLFAGLILVGYGESHRAGWYIMAGGVLMVASVVPFGLAWFSVLMGIVFLPLMYRGYVHIVTANRQGKVE